MVVAGLEVKNISALVPGVIIGFSEMRIKPLPMATVATQTDACSDDGSYWDLLSLTSLVANDDDDADSVVGYVVIVLLEMAAVSMVVMSFQCSTHIASVD